MTWTCPETAAPCERMCLTACHIRSKELVALRAEVERLRGALKPLVAGLQKTTWSSWQTTAHFYEAYERAIAALQKPTP